MSRSDAVTQELLPLSPPLQRRSQEVSGGVGELGGLPVGVDGLLQHVVTAQLLRQAVLRLSTGHEDSADPPGMKANGAAVMMMMMMVVPGPSRSERADSEDAAAPARRKPSEPPPVSPDSPDTQEPLVQQHIPDHQEALQAGSSQTVLVTRI